MRCLTKCLLLVTGLCCLVYVTLLWKHHDVTSLIAPYSGGKLRFFCNPQDVLASSSGSHSDNGVTYASISQPERFWNNRFSSSLIPQTTPPPQRGTSTKRKQSSSVNASSKINLSNEDKNNNTVTKRPEVGTDKTLQVLNMLNNTTLKSTSAVKNKYVIFVCDARRSCGGWGDRQRGLVSVYLLAYVTGRTFGVIVTKPCNVTNFYIPNDLNWVIPKEELIGKSNITIDDVDSRSKITSRLARMDFNQMYPADVVYIRTNGEYFFGLKNSELYAHRLPAWARGSRAASFHKGWDVLMAPSPHLQNQLDEFLTQVNFTHRTRPFVCAHVRVGRSSTFTTDSAVRTNVSDVPVLWNFLETYVRNGSHIFLATDSHEVRNMTRARFGNKVHDTGGKIVHVDKQAHAPGACEGFGAALLDQLVLSKCDVLVTSQSVFSHRASLMRGSDDNLFTFIKGKVSKIKMNR